MCDDENEEGCEEKMCTIGNRTFPYFPKIGLAQSLLPSFIERTKPKEKCSRKIIYLDFETTVVGFSHEGTDSNTRRLEPPLPPQNLPVQNVHFYEPYPFIQRDLDTAMFEYVQTVNHCEAQYEDGSVFIFKSIEETMDFLNMDENNGSVVIAHCGGSFDFQLLMRQFLVCGQLRLKKVKCPLMRGNKIISAQICNNITLLDSYAFVAAALAKFPKIFNIEEEKKDFFLICLTEVSFTIIKGLSLPLSGMILTLFRWRNAKNFLHGMRNKCPNVSFLIFKRRCGRIVIRMFNYFGWGWKDFGICS